MRILAFALMCLFSIVGQSHAATVYHAFLNGAQEVPPNASSATGIGIFTLNNAQDRLDYQLFISGIDLTGFQTPGDTTDDMIAAHIHNAPVGVNGPIVFPIFGPQGTDNDLFILPLGGEMSGSWTASEGLTGFLAALNAGLLYVNIHTPLFPDGEIRGQILAGPLFPVPIPPAFGLLGLALATLGGIAWGPFARRR